MEFKLFNIRDIKIEDSDLKDLKKVTFKCETYDKHEDKMMTAKVEMPRCIINSELSTKLTEREISNTLDFATRLYVYGGKDKCGNEITIEKVNPTGKNYIENFSYFLDKGYSQDYINQHLDEFLFEEVWYVNESMDEQSLYNAAVEKLNSLSNSTTINKGRVISDFNLRIKCLPGLNDYTWSMTLYDIKK